MLPKALIESDDFKSLSDEQRRDLCSRLKALWEIAGDAAYHLLQEGNLDWRAFLEDLELDLSTRVAALADGRSAVTNWQIHWSWSFGIDAPAIRRSITSDIASALNSSPPSTECTPDEFRAWLLDQTETISKIKEPFLGSSSRETAIIHLLTLDVLLANILAAIWRVQLNPSFARR